VCEQSRVITTVGVEIRSVHGSQNEFCGALNKCDTGWRSDRFLPTFQRNMLLTYTEKHGGTSTERSMYMDLTTIYDVVTKKNKFQYN
jgi:hypothetical protein